MFLAPFLSASQFSIAFVSKAGAKVRTLSDNFQMFRKFFSNFFSAALFLVRIRAKEEKFAGVQYPFLSECQFQGFPSLGKRVQK